MRVVSLVPSATEILCLLGGRELLVGRSHECNSPTDAGLGELPVLTKRTTDAGAAPGEIDAIVRADVAAGRPLYRLDERLLSALRPDLILTQDLCGVCSIDLASVRRAAERLDRPARIVSLNPETVEDVLDDVLRVGRAAGLEERARHAAVELRSRLWRAQEHVNPYADGPVVGFLEWTDPLFVAGHWTVQLIERAGGRHPLNPTVARAGSGAAAGTQMGERVAGASVAVAPEAFVASRPEFVVVAPCGVELARAYGEAEALTRRAWWGELPAARSARVAVVDGDAMFNRPGPRLVDAFEWLVGWLNDRPGLMPRGFPWRPLRSPAP
ncbi:MAG TPA: ABC transporter substrate-binding protein [Phycisphaerales bacterium]|nr:ABC transporter substrate-binding protein [Phycisphaerales bacterium]